MHCCCTACVARASVAVAPAWRAGAPRSVRHRRRRPDSRAEHRRGQLSSASWRPRQRQPTALAMPNATVGRARDRRAAPADSHHGIALALDLTQPGEEGGAIQLGAGRRCRAHDATPADRQAAQTMPGEPTSRSPQSGHMKAEGDCTAGRSQTLPATPTGLARSCDASAPFPDLAGQGLARSARSIPPCQDSLARSAMWSLDP